MDGNFCLTEQVLWPISVFSSIIMCKIISLGYFLAELAMILWHFPTLGGKEYILHNGLSMYVLLMSLLSGKGHIYILMVLFTEITTPFVNLRWYLDIVGQKNSTLYIYNGVALFLGWLVARIILFVYFFAHMYLHFDQVREHAAGVLASFLKGRDEELSRDFRDQAYSEEQSTLKKRKQRSR